MGGLRRRSRTDATLRSASPHTLGGVAAYLAKTFPWLGLKYSCGHITSQALCLDKVVPCPLRCNSQFRV